MRFPSRCLALRVARQIVEIGIDHLAMSTEEAAALLHGAGATVSAAETEELVNRTEGWPAGLYLAALAIKSGAPATGFSFRGDDRLVDDYLRSELLARLSPSQGRFLISTAILDQMSGPLCDAVLGGNGVGADARGARATQPTGGPARSPRRVVPLPPPPARAAPGRAQTR